VHVTRRAKPLARRTLRVPRPEIYRTRQFVLAFEENRFTIAPG
jgi:hypothetical protein